MNLNDKKDICVYSMCDNRSVLLTGRGQPYSLPRTREVDLMALASHAPIALKTISLLVVEDSEAYRYLIERAFRNRKGIQWNLTIANDGERALQILFLEEHIGVPLPDLILLDWHMPKVGGCEVLHRIKAHEELRKIPVIIFSSSASQEDIQAAYRDHANCFITKPDSPEELAAVVETIEQFWISVAQLPKVRR